MIQTAARHDVSTLPLFAWAMTMPKRRRDGRFHDTGRVKPRRPCPRDFRETYVRMGWDGIMEHYHANWRCISRWIDECGRTELKMERAEFVRANGVRRLHVEPGEQCLADRQNRRRRYVLGQTLSGRSGE